MLVYRLPGTLEDEELTALLWEAGATGLEERGGLLRAYFEEEQPFTEWPDLAGGEWLEEEDRDWQAEWKQSLRPVQAGRVTVVPGWLLHEVPPGQVPLIIEPGMAFGTGHHATTRMAVEALSALDLEGQTVLDVGTGSGVLAMAASLLGASEALGLDIDPLTIPVAFENAEANGFVKDAPGLHHTATGRRLNFMEGTLDGEDIEDSGRYDVLVANLYAELHDLLAPDYRTSLRAGGPLILTGILEPRLPLVRAALEREGFLDVQERLDGEWALVTARNGED
ncbi:50S ribosomal protein L11 methyltransferase [Deinococcus sp. KNUC1210]|uniref:50S ribosomal protein L11 methyltransferase n=1 Tax=Deinococcus sp. KNUC1210 TaxID=2917691 RepID=UPI001EF0DC80|nr:50S ribosomal protein L11 methyltransferase [Deinococcus sp. KNUC1210]ULH16408.1 50S ribosomal protein L11 methyltransferase [Deinococcus sp. KNUC1210]